VLLLNGPAHRLVHHGEMLFSGARSVEVRESAKWRLRTATISPSVRPRQAFTALRKLNGGLNCRLV
jgi:hypothetical protein